MPHPTNPSPKPNHNPNLRPKPNHNPNLSPNPNPNPNLSPNPNPNPSPNPNPTPNPPNQVLNASANQQGCLYANRFKPRVEVQRLCSVKGLSMNDA